MSAITVKLGKMQLDGSSHYPVYARFESVAGLKKGAHVEMAGVQVGKVEDIALDTAEQVAMVKLKIQNRIQLTDDVIASVKTAGLIGDKYIKLSPGGSDIPLAAGDKIVDTESAVDLEALISKYVFGKV